TLESPYLAQGSVGVRLFAYPIPALDYPVVDDLVLRRLRLRVRQAKQVAVRPAVALLVLDCLQRQLVGGHRVPGRHRVTQTTTPAAQTVNVLCEVEQVRARAANAGQHVKGDLF